MNLWIKIKMLTYGEKSFSILLISIFSVQSSALIKSHSNGSNGVLNPTNKYILTIDNYFKMTINYKTFI